MSSSSRPPPVPMTTRNSQLIFGFTITFFVLALCMVLLREYARRIRRQQLRIEDYLVFASLVTFLGQCIITCCLVILGGAGHPESTIDRVNIETAFRVLPGLTVFYALTLVFSKLSLCLFYTRVFALRSFRIAAITIMVIVVLWAILLLAMIIIFNGACRGPAPHGSLCAGRRPGYLAVSIIDAIIDLAIMLLPLPVVWNLQLPLPNRIGLSFIFCIGIVSVVIAALRARYTTTIHYGDFTHSGTNLFIMNSVEPGAAIMVASSLVLGPLIRKRFHGGQNPSHTKRNSKRYRHVAGSSFELRSKSYQGGSSTAQLQDSPEEQTYHVDAVIDTSSWNTLIDRNAIHVHRTVDVRSSHLTL